MAVPRPRSYQQILGDMLDAFLSRKGINDLRPGSAILSILEAAAQNDFRSSEDIFAVMDAFSIDRATGEVLDRLAADNDIERFTASTATGNVTFTDGGITKIATKIYPGTAAPNIGSVVINVADASSFPLTGQVYLGRNTGNFEGPIAYGSKVQVGSYWQLNLSSPTTQFHNLSESVILKQGGNRVIPAGTVVQTPQGNVSVAVRFQTTVSVTMPDGENTLSGVPVVALTPGSVGNVPRGAVSEVPSPPFPNLMVTNPIPFVTGQDQEADIDLRSRIKNAIQSRSKGTSLAIESAVIGITSTDEPKRVLSSKVVEQIGLPTRLIIDDGSGYEEFTTGVGELNVVDFALGGEQYLQLPNRSIAKANLVTILETPFALADNDMLSVLVGGVRSEHIFQEDSFKAIGSATAFEVASSINSDPDLLFSASTSSGGTKVRIFAKSDNNEDLQITTPSVGNDANDALGFIGYLTYSLYLYKNDDLLYKDGQIPTLTSITQALWAPIVSGDTLVIEVDGTPPLTVTVVDADFVTNNTGYSTVASTNSLASWATVFNAKIPGVTASVSGSQLKFVSNRGASDNASLKITGGTMVVQGMWTVSESIGQSSDYILNRNTGQITLTEPLVAGDRVTAGSRFTRAYVQSGEHLTGYIDLNFDANFWVVVDGDAEIVNLAIDNGDTLDVSAVGSIWKYKVIGSAAAFADVEVGDWIVMWDPSVTDASNRGYWRVCETGLDGGDGWAKVEKSAGVVASYTLNAAGVRPGIFAARSAAPMQQITITAGLSQGLAIIIGKINGTVAGGDRLIGASASVVAGNSIRLTTDQFGPDGGILFLTADIEGRKLLFDEEVVASSRVSHTAFAESGNSELGTPLFVNDVIAVGSGGLEPPVNFTSGIDYQLVGNADPNSFVAFLRPIGTGRCSSNRYNHGQIKNLATTLVTMNSKDTLHEILANDRAYPAMPYDMDSEDSLVVLIDNDAVNNTFAIQMARRIEINNTTVPTATQFNVFDIDQGPTAPLSTAFGTTFSFDNFKLWMKARNLLDPSTTKSAVIFRFADFGSSGNWCRVGYFYPTAPSMSFDSNVTIGEWISINIVLPSGVARSLSSDGTTQFDVTGVGAGPFTVTYTHNGTGPAPDFVLNGVVVGDIVTIGPNPPSGFSANNIGTWRITNVTATSITVTRPTAGTPENNIPLGAASSLQIYPLDSTSTANDVITYVNTNLSNYIGAVLTVEDPIGTLNDGSGLIDKSTLDELGYGTLPADQYVTLVDGENWILTTNLVGSPNLILKQPLVFVDPLYFSVSAGIIGEQLRLIPTTADQFSRYLNIPATSGITTVSGLSAAQHESKVQLYSSQLGSDGSVQVTGGTANAIEADIIGSAATVDTSYTRIRIDSALKRGWHSKQFIRISSTTSQPKLLGFTTSTQIQVISGTPNIINLAVAGTFRTARTLTADGTTQYQLERNGDFVAIVHAAGTDPGFVAGSVTEGDWVTLDSSWSLQNQGTFRVIRRYLNTIWIENSDAVEETSVASATAVTFVTYDSILPGDTLRISGAVLGVANEGSFTVTAVNSSSQIEVSGTMVSTVGFVTPGNDFNSVQIIEQNPFEAIKRIHTLAYNPSDSDQIDILLDGTVLNNKISAVGGASIHSLNKFGFSVDAQVGIDGYRRHLGLIYEANRVVYGDPTNPTIFPGIKAAGAQLNIEGPIIKRIQVALSIRVRTGVPFNVVQDQVKSNVAAAIAQVPVGTSVVISDLVTAAGSVDGVLSVAVVSPTFDENNDLIQIQAYEKPLVIDPDVDIIVSQVGG